MDGNQQLTFHLKTFCSSYRFSPFFLDYIFSISKIDWISSVLHETQLMNYEVNT